MDVAGRIFDDLDRFLRTAGSARPDCTPGLDLVRAHVAGMRAGAAIARAVDAGRDRFGLRPFLRELGCAQETTPEPEVPTVAESPVGADPSPTPPVDADDIPF